MFTLEKFTIEIKEVQKKMKVFSYRTSNPGYKEKIQQLNDITNPILKGTKFEGKFSF
jgi:hypothetical protein